MRTIPTMDWSSLKTHLVVAASAALGLAACGREASNESAPAPSEVVAPAPSGSTTPASGPGATSSPTVADQREEEEESIERGGLPGSEVPSADPDRFERIQPRVPVRDPVGRDPAPSPFPEALCGASCGADCSGETGED